MIGGVQNLTLVASGQDHKDGLNSHKVYSSRVSVQTVGAWGDSGRRQGSQGSWKRRDKIVLASSRPMLSGLQAGDAAV